MPADLSVTLTSKAISNEVVTTPNEVFSVQASGKVRVESKNLEAGADEWIKLGNVFENTSRSFIATSEAIRIVSEDPDDSAIEVFL